MPAEQTPMAQKPVMMRGRRPTLSIVKHCQERAETDRVLGSSKVHGTTPEPQIQLKVGGSSWWHLGIQATPAQSSRAGDGAWKVPGVSMHGSGDGSHRAGLGCRVGAGWGDLEATQISARWRCWGSGCLWGSGQSRVWAGAAAAGAGRVLTAEQMPVIL